MAKYKAAPGYSVSYGKGEDAKTVRFDYFGEYETAAAAEIKALDGLVPRWITKVVEEISEESPEVEPKPKPPARKPSGK